jgi:2-C-methyl-D-erythritol 4-phosphate cytidylyltransferase
MNIVMLMMAGSGVRFGADIPKQFVEVEGRPIYSYIVDAYNRSPLIDKIVIVTHKNWIDYVHEWKEKRGADKLCVVVAGGDCRSESVKNGLLSMEDFASEEDVILIHDATHPYVDEEGNAQIIEAVKTYGGATLGQRQYDTVYQMDRDTHMLKKVVPREEIVSGASSEAFRYGDLYRIYTGASREELESMTSAGAIALHYGIPMKVIGASVINLKITYKKDMDTFKGMIRSYFPE